MHEEDILRNAPSVLTQAQRRQFFADGFLTLENYVDAGRLLKLNAALDEMIEASRSLAESNGAYVLEAGHSAASPRLHRISNPQDLHPAVWDFFLDPLLTDLAADVVGPDVKFHHAKLNLKAPKGVERFQWHQDIVGWPHTDFSPVTFGIYLNGCSSDQGPLSLLPGSHRGPLHDIFNEAGDLIQGAAESLKGREAEIVAPTGGSGTLLILNCRIIHGSGLNTSDRARPLLLPVYSSADSFPYTPSRLPTPRMGEIVRGQPARFASFDASRCPLAPNDAKGPWSRKGVAREAY